jgi:hypothetical protein
MSDSLTYCELGSTSSAKRERSNRPHREKKQNRADRQAADNLGDRPTSDNCRVSGCPREPSSAYGLCPDHRNKIADAFEQFYVAAQNVIENLAVCDIKGLPEAQIDDPFIRRCDRFLKHTMPHWLEDQDASSKIRTRKSERSSRAMRRRKP